MSSMKKIILIISFPVIFALGLWLGTLSGRQSNACNNKFIYINPTLNCDFKQVIEKSNLITLKEKLNAFIDLKKRSGEVNTLAIYFRDLHDGPILGINENEEFIGASLLKLPTALTFFKMAEEEYPDILNRRLHYEGEVEETDNLEQFFKPAQTIKAGSSYTVGELIFNSLVHSDNLSNEVLKASLKSIQKDKDLILQTYRELGLVAPRNIQSSDLSTRVYASLFRILYNASYLSATHSEKILSLLAQSTFNKGLATGVPENIKVANKFGERFLNEDKQLHDCGIVYYPDNPYVLCVMTRGTDFQKLAKVITQISEMVYQEVDSRLIK